MSDDIVIEAATADLMPYVIAGAHREGWNPGQGDASSFYAADPDGFLVARCEGEPVGCISAVRYGAGFGFIGLYIVEPQMRGRGIGGRLWSQGMQRLAGRVVGLDGVVAMQHAYRESGFVLAHRNVRFAGIVPAGVVAPDGVARITTEDLPDVIAYDAECFGADRAAFIHAWLAQPGVSAFVVRKGNALVGYTVVRPCADGSKFGPLFADDPDVAERLFAAGSAALPVGSSRILDVPEPNAASRAMAEAGNLRPVFETARMYAGGSWTLPLDRIHGITSFELG